MKIYGLLLPQRDLVRSEINPMSGSVSASVNRGSALSSPTSAGFIPKPRFRTIVIPPIAAASRLLTNPPMPYRTLLEKGILSSSAVSKCLLLFIEAQPICQTLPNLTALSIIVNDPYNDGAALCNENET